VFMYSPLRDCPVLRSSLTFSLHVDRRFGKIFLDDTPSMATAHLAFPAEGRVTGWPLATRWQVCHHGGRTALGRNPHYANGASPHLSRHGKTGLSHNMLADLRVPELGVFGHLLGTTAHHGL